MQKEHPAGRLMAFVVVEAEAEAERLAAVAAAEACRPAEIAEALLQLALEEFDPVASLGPGCQAVEPDPPEAVTRSWLH